MRENRVQFGKIDQVFLASIAIDIQIYLGILISLFIINLFCHLIGLPYTAEQFGSEHRRLVGVKTVLHGAMTRLSTCKQGQK